MRMLFLSVIFILATNAFGRPTVEKIDKLKHFISANNSCVLAVATPAGEGAISPIYCIWDGVYNAGTINEGQSCMLGTLDASTGRYGPLNGYAGVNAKETLGKSCSLEMVDSILHKIPVNHFQPSASAAPFEKEIQKSGKVILLFDKYGLWGLKADQIKSKKPEVPREVWGNIPFDLPIEKLIALNLCKIELKTKFEDEGDTGYTCPDMRFDGRLVEGSFYFTKGRLTEYSLGVGVTTKGTRVQITEDLKNYLKFLNDHYPGASASVDAFSPVFNGTQKYAEVLYHNGKVALRFFRTLKGEFGAFIFFRKEKKSSLGASVK